MEVTETESVKKFWRYNSAMFRKFATRPDWQIALTATLSLRVFFTAVAAAFSPFLHPDAALIRSNALTENLPAPHGLHYALLGVWERFDTLWYLHIAQYGYDRPMAVIFYPLYPALIRIVMEASIPAIVAALLVSTVAAFFSFWGLLRLAGPGLSAQLTSQSTRKTRICTLLVIAAWPSSFVLFAGYAESLTLALIVWALIFAREGRWELATQCGFLAGLSRPSGVLVAVPLFVLALRSRRVRSLIVILSPLGTLGYWNWLRWSGRLSVVEAYRIYQGATFAPPWASLAEILRLVMAHGDAVLAVKFVLVGLALAFSLQREVRIEDKLFALALTVQMLMYTGRPLLGGPRYVLPMYPAFLAMGAYAARRWSAKKFGFYLTFFGCVNLAWMWAFLSWSLVF
jgi:hypothetical protein